MYVHNSYHAIERKRILKAFRSSGAVAPEHARTLQRLGLDNGLILRRLRDQRIVREVKAGEFYLDEDVLKESESALLKWLAVPFALLLMLLIYAIATGNH